MLSFLWQVFVEIWGCSRIRRTDMQASPLLQVPGATDYRGADPGDAGPVSPQAHPGGGGEPPRHSGHKFLLHCFLSLAKLTILSLRFREDIRILGSWIS